jgi:hypothetical protein
VVKGLFIAKEGIIIEVKVEIKGVTGVTGE